jgi:hypothetical protein
VRDSEIVTVPIDTTGLGAPFVVPPDATIAIRVEQKIERLLEGQVVHADVREADVQLIVDPPSIAVRLVGARSLVNAMDVSLLRVSVPEVSLVNMLPGEQRVVPVQIDGTPGLVTAEPDVGVVRVRRVSELPEGPEQDPS